MSQRVTQLVQEVIRAGENAPIRVTQDVMEVVSVPTSRYARVTQCVIEVLRKNESETTARQPVVIVVC